MRYLTKSRFKLALECITKLYYTKKDDYADESIDDPFLEALADGGFQVGELAKYLFCDDPSGQSITINTLDYDQSLKETAIRLKQKSAIIAEAAFRFQSLFVRADIIVKNGNTIDLYEVKSKSTDGEDIDFITKRGESKIASIWVPYLYDVALQKHVITKALATQNVTVHTHLILVDKSKTAGVDGLNQKFKILKTKSGSKIEVEPNLTKRKLGNSILKVLNVDKVIQQIWDEFPVPNDFDENIKFKDFVSLCANAYNDDKRIYAPLGSKCRDCQFINSNYNDRTKKSGFHECWKNKTKLSESQLNECLVLDLWCGLSGGRSLVQELIDKGKYFLKDVSEEDIAPKSSGKTYIGLSPHERRIEQITRVKSKTQDCYFDKKGFKKEMSSWMYPLHMIDFETSMTALPFHKGKHPYEGIAFQFSHHIIEKNGNIRHAGQYLSFVAGSFPNYEFARKLKSQLEKDEGTIFRYHNHENTYLNFIVKQLDEDKNPPKDKDALKRFIRSITNWKDETSVKVQMRQGKRCMVDLHRLVLKYYYSPFAKGSNSIKQILPAIIQESTFLKSKYSKPVYGKLKQIKSLNFDEHVWIDQACDMDPYKTLPRLFNDYDANQLDKFFGGFDELADGGAAMTAYNYLQFSHIPNDQRDQLRDGLLRYCELDTLAMVMILESWLNN